MSARYRSMPRTASTQDSGNAPKLARLQLFHAAEHSPRLLYLERVLLPLGGITLSGGCPAPAPGTFLTWKHGLQPGPMQTFTMGHQAQLDAGRRLSNRQMHPLPRQPSAHRSVERSSLSSESILDAASGILDFPLYLVSASLGLELRVTYETSNAFLDGALRLLR